MSDTPPTEAIEPLRDTFEDILTGVGATAWLSGAMAMKFRVMKNLMAMGERDLAATIGRMDVPTQQNWNDRETVISERTEA